MRWLLILMLWCGSAQAEPWTLEQKQIGAVMLAASIVDYRQTLTIAHSNGYWHEYNPILGYQPSQRRVNIYFALVPVLAYVALDYMPSDTRTTVMKIAAITQLVFVGRNAYLGIGMRY